MSPTEGKLKRSPGRPKQETDGTPMRETILNTASRLFMELGYEPVSLKMIAGRAGVTKASVYYYFSNKAELFATAVIEMFVRIRMRTKAILDADGDLKERLIRLARVKLSASHTDFESMMREAEPSLSEIQLQGIRQAEHGLHGALDEAFRAAMVRGELAEGDSMLLAHAFSALLMLGNRERLGDRKPTAEELSSELVELFLNGAARH
ncbi:TetR/AcrR family transcriptional regulator [Cohnella panacarvi]|uniref:TetR/AcrR family transcriptional regulator n=1 Tax=Cohnella panacarvi TaxID=400776 RepID=UPI00047C541B|nr:TetR/AcrR family transcriptional regulator [Cohnella panacarvi]